MYLKKKCGGRALGIAVGITLVVLLLASGASAGTVTRSLSYTTVTPDTNIIVTLTPTSDVPAGIGWQVTEALPAGFNFVSSNADSVTRSGQTVTLLSSSANPITYTVRSSNVYGTYTFSGTFKDGNLNTGMVSGTTSVTVGLVTLTPTPTATPTSTPTSVPTPVGTTSPGTVTRTYSAATVAPGGTLTVTLTPSPSNLFDLPGYQVVETVPSGFTVTANTAINSNSAGNVYTFIQIGSTPVTYTLTAPASEGAYTFSGTFKDDNLDTGNVAGTSTVHVSAASAGEVERRMARRVSPGGNVTVELTPIGEVFDSPGYQVTETIPEGFIFRRATAGAITNSGNVYTFTQMGNGAIKYVVTAPSTAGNYSFSGSFKDELNMGGTIPVSNITVQDVVAEYKGSDNKVNRIEANDAVVAFFSINITFDDVVRIVLLFFRGSVT